MFRLLTQESMKCLAFLGRFHALAVVHHIESISGFPTSSASTSMCHPDDLAHLIRTRPSFTRYRYLLLPVPGQSVWERSEQSVLTGSSAGLQVAIVHAGELHHVCLVSLRKTRALYIFFCFGKLSKSPPQTSHSSTGHRPPWLRRKTQALKKVLKCKHAVLASI